MSRLVVFDVDGTILDSFDVYKKIATEYSRQKGLPVPCFHSILTGYGAPYDHDFKWGCSREEQVEHLKATYRIADDLSRSGNPEHTPTLFGGVKEGIEKLLAQDYTLAIVTSKPEEPLMHMLEQHGITGHFSALRHGDDKHHRKEREKPAPDQLLSVMRDLGFSGEATVMIGDTTMDIRMGRGALSHTIGVTWGAHSHHELTGAGAHHIVDTHFDDVVSLIKKEFQKK